MSITDKKRPTDRKRRLRFENLEGRRLLAAVSIPTDLTAPPAAVVATPVNIDLATGVRGVEIRLTYNTDLLDLDVAGITAGTIWASANDTQVTANVNEAAGTATIFVASSQGAPAAPGSLVILAFTVASDAVVGSTATIDLTEVVLNEGQIPVAPAPILGPDSTDGLITIRQNGGTGSDRISGFVYADTNNNLTPETVEGIPGVVVTLINQATQEQRQTTTAADGSYQFANLPAGTYLIRQQQPIAYIDGGNNELTRQLVSDQPLTDQNFRELGLRAQFLYTRLLATQVQPVGSLPWTKLIEKINGDAALGTVTAPAPRLTGVASSTNAAEVTRQANTIAASTNVPSLLSAFNAVPTPLPLMASEEQTISTAPLTSGVPVDEKDDKTIAGSTDEMFPTTSLY